MDMREKDTGNKTVLLREEIGQVLRMVRRSQGRTLREVSTSAQVSLGYLSEVERGQKEASSELLAAICKALEGKYLCGWPWPKAYRCAARFRKYRFIR